MSRAEIPTKIRSQDRKKANSKALPGSAPLLAGKSLNAVLCFLLAAFTIALYSPAGAHPFFNLDDNAYVTTNSHIRDGLRWSTIRWAFTSTEAANWHPLTWLSHAFDYQLFGMNPAGHHWDNVLIHAVNAVLLFLLLGWATKRVGPSLFVAALFAWHPINVESVAWVAERKNVLSTLFFFLAIGAYTRYAQRPDWRRYLLVSALFAAGLMAKPMVITLPFVLLLLDYWPLGRSAGSPPSSIGPPQSTLGKLLVEKVPLLFLSALSAVITVKAQRSGEAVRSLSQFPLGIRIENAVVTYVLYLWKMLWPARLAPFYPYSGDRLPLWQLILSALILVSVTALVLVFRQRRYLLLGWLWFLGTLVPVIGLVQVGDAAMADRYAYVPLIGIFVMIAWSLDDLAESKNIPTAGKVIPGLCILAALGFVTSRQLSYWENGYALWSHTLAVTKRNPFAEDSLASAVLDPNVTTANNLEDLDTQQKRMDKAREHLGQALELRRQLAQRNPDPYLPAMATTLNNMGFVDRLQNRMDESRQEYDEALKIRRQLTRRNPEAYQPFLAMTLNDLGTLNGIQNRTDNARLDYEEALKIRVKLAQENPDTYLPDLALTLNNLGNLDGVQNRTEDAHQHYEESSKLYRQLAQRDPNIYLPFVAGTLKNMGLLDKKQNRIDSSRSHYTEALTIYRQLALGDSGRYAGDIARVEASLQALDKKAPSQ